jgi:hypothetical protein
VSREYSGPGPSEWAARSGRQAYLVPRQRGIIQRPVLGVIVGPVLIPIAAAAAMQTIAVMMCWLALHPPQGAAVRMLNLLTLTTAG